MGLRAGKRGTVLQPPAAGDPAPKQRAAPSADAQALGDGPALRPTAAGTVKELAGRGADGRRPSVAGRVRPHERDRVHGLVDGRLQALLRATEAASPAAAQAAAVRRDVGATRRALSGAVLQLLRENLRTTPNDQAQAFADWSVTGSAPLAFVVPAPHTYGEQSWKWDLAFGSLIAGRLGRYVHGAQGAAGSGAAKRAELAEALQTVAQGCVFAALQHQVADGPNRGMVPHMNFSGGADAELWKHPRRSSITQPPVIPMALRAIADGRVRRALYPAVREELRWWLRERLDGGVPFVVHPWETGRDAGRDHDSQLAPFMGTTPASLRLQTDNPGRKDERSKTARFALLEVLQSHTSDAAEIVSAQAKQHYNLTSPDLAALLVLALEDGATLAHEFSAEGDAAEFRQAAQSIRRAVNERMWDEADGFYYSLGRRPAAAAVRAAGMTPEMCQVDDAGRIRARLASAFTTLAAQIPTDAQAERLLAALESARFATPTPLPTVATDDPGYVADDYWRGSTWINVNVFAVHGLLAYAERFAARGEAAAAQRFARAGLELGWRTVQATSRGFYEYYASDQPPGCAQAGCGPEQFTWSALSFNLLDSIEKLETLVE